MVFFLDEKFSHSKMICIACSSAVLYSLQMGSFILCRCFSLIIVFSYFLLSFSFSLIISLEVYVRSSYVPFPLNVVFHHFFEKNQSTFSLFIGFLCPGVLKNVILLMITNDFWFYIMHLHVDLELIMCF